ncbi:hypothetical protein K2P97_00190 [bacterium]|nr:hypothetical protein [bacterium]
MTEIKLNADNTEFSVRVAELQDAEAIGTIHDESWKTHITSTYLWVF